MTTTAYITIGNSDNKLTQTQWSDFCTAVDMAVAQARRGGTVVHFHGYSLPAAPWQNALWAVELPADAAIREALRGRLARLAHAYNQDAVAWATTEQVEFLTGAAAPPAATW